MKKNIFAFRFLLSLVLMLSSLPFAQGATYEGCSSVYNNGASDCQSGGDTSLYQYNGSCQSTTVIDAAKSTCNAQLKYYDTTTNTYSTSSGDQTVATYAWSSCSCKSTCTAAATSSAVKDDYQADVCTVGQTAVFSGSTCQYSCQTVTPTYLTKYVGGTGSSIESSIVFQGSNANFSGGAALGAGTASPTALFEIQEDANESEDVPLLRAVEVGTKLPSPLSVTDLLKNLIAKFQNAIDRTVDDFGAFLVFNDGSIGIERSLGGGDTRITQFDVDANGDFIQKIFNIDNAGDVTYINEETIGGSGGKFVDGTDPLDAVYMDGNVGIGTETPDLKLTVAGATRIIPPVPFFGIDGGLIIGNEERKGDFQIGDRFTFSDGYVGNADLDRAYDFLGTNVYVKTSGSFPNPISHATKRIEEDPAQAMYLKDDGDISFRTAPDGLADTDITWTETLNLKNDGNVHIPNNLGIGTATPSSKVEISSGQPMADTTLLTLTNGDETGDLTQEKTFIDFNLVDSNENFTPQVRIGAEVGQNGNADSIEKEGSGAFVVYTATGTSSTTGDLTEKMRVSYNGNVGIGITQPVEPLHVNGNIQAGEFFYDSDERLKENISPLQNALQKVLSLKGVLFDWKKTGKTSIGFIAQEVEEILPEVVKTSPIGENLKSISYGNLTAVLVEAVKEQQKQIDELKAQVQALSQ